MPLLIECAASPPATDTQRLRQRHLREASKAAGYLAMR